MNTQRSMRATILLALSVAGMAGAVWLFGGDHGPPPGASRAQASPRASAQDAANAMLADAVPTARVDATAATAQAAAAEPMASTPSEPASAASPFAAIDVQLARVAEGVAAERLQSPANTRIGDRLRIGISSDRELYVYAFNQEAGGTPTVMFPLAALDQKNPLPGGEHELPGTVMGAHQSYTVESRAPSEEILLVLSTVALPSLQARVAAMAAVAAGDAAPPPADGSDFSALDAIDSEIRAAGNQAQSHRWRLGHQHATAP